MENREQSRGACAVESAKPGQSGHDGNGAAGQATDPHLAALMKDYKKYRNVTIVLGICALATLIAAMALFKGGIIDGETQVMVIMVCYAFVGLMLLVVFARVRPIKADIRDWNTALEEARSKPHKKKSKKIAAATEARETSGRPSRKSKHPDTPEYKSARRKWYALIMVATAVMLSAMVTIRINPGNFMIAMIILASSYIFIILAMRIERLTLKPMREQWDAKQAKALRKEACEVASEQK